MKLSLKSLLIGLVATMLFSSCGHFHKECAMCKAAAEQSTDKDASATPKKHECEACKKGT